MAQSFFFGGDTPMTYEDLQRKRQIAERLRESNAQTPRNAGEGLAAIGRAIMARRAERDASARDAELRGAFNENWDSIFSRGAPSGQAPTEAPAMSEADQIGNDTMASLIKTGLVERGIPEHVAEGFVMNFQDESNLDPGINEIAPTVPGSRGGYGLAQWTGPRRKALEDYASGTGAQVGDMGTQLDFLLSELQGPESRAAGSMMAAPDAGAAAAAIARDYLRPAPEHLASRTAKYTGQTQQPQRAQPHQQADIYKLAELAGSPYASPSQKAIVQALIGTQMQQQDPAYQLGLEKSRLELEAMRNPQPKQTGTMQEYNFARSQGYSGSFQDYQKELKKAGATTVTTNMGEAAKPLGTKGDILVQDPNSPSGYKVVPAEGSEAAGEAIKAKTTSEMATAQASQALTLIQSIKTDPALKNITGNIQGNMPAGIPLITGGQAGTDLGVKVKQLQGKTFLQAFETLKGGGQITEREGEAAQNAMARLNRAQSYDAYLKALTELEDIIKLGLGRAAGEKPPEASDDDLLKKYGVQ